MPEYGQPIENDLNFQPVLDFFRGKKGKFDGSKRIGKPEMTRRTPEQRTEERDIRSKNVLGGTSSRSDAFDSIQPGNPPEKKAVDIEQAWDFRIPGRKKKEPNVKVGPRPDPSTITDAPIKPIPPRINRNPSSNTKINKAHGEEGVPWHSGRDASEKIDGYTVADWKQFGRTPKSLRVPGQDYSRETELGVTSRDYPQDSDTAGVPTYSTSGKLLSGERRRREQSVINENSLLKLMKAEERPHNGERKDFAGTEPYEVPTQVQFRPTEEGETGELTDEEGNTLPYVQEGPAKYNEPNIQNALLKLMKAPVVGDDEAKWKDPRNNPEDFPGKPRADEAGSLEPSSVKNPPDILHPSSMNIAAHGGRTTPDLRGVAWREKEREREGKADALAHEAPSPSRREDSGRLRDMLRERREQEADIMGMPEYSGDEKDPDLQGPPSFPPSKYGGKRPKGFHDAIRESEAERQSKLTKPWRENWENSVENSLLKIMKDGDIIPSKVGMSRSNVTKNLEKVTSQAMGQQPGAFKRQAPVPAASSLSSAAETETAGAGQGVDVGRIKEYEALGQAGNIADYLVGGALQGIGAASKAGAGATKLGAKAGIGGAKLGVRTGGKVARGIGSLFGGQNPVPNTVPPN